MEEWKDIPGYEGYYKISSNGMVKSLARIVGKSKKHLRERILKHAISTRGYAFIELSREGVKTTHRINRLVLMAFVGMPEPGQVACHFPDKNQLNNNIENLRWDTNKGNEADKLIHGTSSRGERNNLAKLKEAQVLEIKEMIKGNIPMRIISKNFNVCKSTIKAIRSKQNWGWLGN